MIPSELKATSSRGAPRAFFSCRVLIWQIPLEFITDHPLVASIARGFFAGFQRTSASPKISYKIDAKSLSLWRNQLKVRDWSADIDLFPAFEGLLYSDLIYEADGLILHSAALLFGGKSWLVVGASGAGKSTLAARMTLSGFLYLGDENSRVDSQLQAEGLPRPLKLDDEPVDYELTDVEDVGYRFRDAEGNDRKGQLWLWNASLRATGRWPLGGIIVISHGKEKLASSRRLSAAEAVAALWPEVRGYRFPDTALLQALVSKHPVFRLHTHSSDQARDALLRIVGNL